MSSKRIIKFRGWNGVKWVYGSLLEWKDGTRYICVEQEDGTLKKIYVHPDSVGQFIGRTDKKEKEIYEKDFVRVWKVMDVGSYPFGIVIYDEDEVSYVIDHPDSLDIKKWWSKKDNEVIGNTFENPELLKEM